MKWKRRHSLMIVAAIAGVVFVAKTASWVSIGCPLGFTLGSCATGMLGRTITASSDHFLGNGVALTASSELAEIEFGTRRVAVRGDEATIDGTSKVAIPANCRELDFAVWGERLEVKADGKLIRSVAIEHKPAPR